MFKNLLLTLSGVMLSSSESNTTRAVGAGLIVVGITRLIDQGDASMGAKS